MEITEVRIFLRESEDRKLKAYATITIDNSFVIRNVKVIEGNKGLFVAMPSRKLREACPKCRYKNPIRSRFCNQCGTTLPQHEEKMDSKDGRQSGHRDIAHPITPECREYIQGKVLDAYREELNKSGKSASDEEKEAKVAKEPAKSSPEPAAKETAGEEKAERQDTGTPQAGADSAESDVDEDFEGDLEL